MSTKHKLPKPLTPARLASLSNDLSAARVTGTRYEWRQVARHFRDELDRLHDDTARLRDAVAAVTIAEEMRVAGLSELRQWQARRRKRSGYKKPADI